MIFCFVQGSPSTAVTTAKPSAPVSGGDNKLELGQERAMSGNSSVYSWQLAPISFISCEIKAYGKSLEHS